MCINPPIAGKIYLQMIENGGNVELDIQIAKMKRRRRDELLGNSDVIQQVVMGYWMVDGIQDMGAL